MKFLIKNLMLGFVLLTSYVGTAQTLRVLNPDNWSYVQGSIEDAQFTIQPRGIYMEVGMYLTLSVPRTTDLIVNSDTTGLEARLKFNLPSGAMVTDSWLWVYEDIIQADIEERWQATRTFENIVGYRLDPSLLTKDKGAWFDPRQDDDYFLRVFPLLKDSTRRVKITYLVPGNWSNGKVSIPLPTDILKDSKTPVENISIQCFLNNDFSKPQIQQLPNLGFDPATHATLGDHFQLFLSWEDIKNDLVLTLDVPMQEGVFLSNYQKEDISYYQLVVLPELLFQNGANPPRKVAVVIDYEAMNTTFSKEYLLSTLQDELVANLRPIDFFNLIFMTPNGPQVINSNWVNAEEPTIRTMFNLLEEAFVLAEQSHLPRLLNEGIDFIQNNGGDGHLLLLSCDQQFLDQELAEEFIAALTPILSTGSISIQVADYQNLNQGRSYQYGVDEEGNYYEISTYGNEYFYDLLTSQTDGYLQVIREQISLKSLLQKSLSGIDAIQGETEIRVSQNSGNCFSEFTLPRPFFDDPDVAILQVGKCAGNLPYTIELTGKVNNETINKSITIDKPAINEGTTSHVTSWAGNYIYSLEQNSPYKTLTQRMVEEIIDWSIQYRVLSLYTAFLALEENLGGYVCKECVDETILETSLDIVSGETNNPSLNDVELPNISFGGAVRGEELTLPVGDSIITATQDLTIAPSFDISTNPNPFTTSTTIEIQWEQNLSNEEIYLSIFDLKGCMIKSLNPQRTLGGQSLQIFWDGTNSQQQKLNAGIYILNIRTATGQRSYKLVLME